MKAGVGCLALVAGLALAQGCAHAPSVPPETLARLMETPRGYLAGPVAGLGGDTSVLNNQDFIWALDFSPEGGRVAYSRLGLKAYNLSVWSLTPEPRLLTDPDINAQQWDVEGVAFSPNGARVAAVSRDGSVRVFDATNGQVQGVFTTEEPLVSVAFHPSGRWLAMGSAQGLVSVVSVPELTFAAELRAHAGPVSALAFALDGTLYTGGWDKHVRAFRSSEQRVRADHARTRFVRQGGFAVVQGSIQGKAPVALALDARAPAVLLTTAAAGAAGINVAALTDSLSVPGALGTTVARLAHGQSLRFKSLAVDNVDVAICDACVPQGLQGVLGAPFTDRVEVSFDEAADEALLSLKGGAPSDAGAVATLVLEPRSDFSYEGHVNDVTVDARGARLGVAFSEEKAERSRTVYERERKNIEEPRGPWNAGALVDAATGQVLRKWERHHGVVSTAAISPDGRALASGGWDKSVYLFAEGQDAPLGERAFGWSVRRVRFSPDGQWLGVAAWTPQKATGNQESDPAAVLTGVRYVAPTVERREPPVAAQ
ncbi:aspartyl protease family protein [Myxococcaceae bacterium JPH2]|nr:aspartyl protease family protein [Myxococcaceae bacterium JPH2]